MSNSETPRLGRPPIPTPDGKPVVRKEVLLFSYQVDAIMELARETKDRDGVAGSFSEALRDVVGYWMEREGKQ